MIEYVKKENVKMKIPPILFIIVFWIWIGWFLFSIWGGIGIISLPLDLILDYFYRPWPWSASEIAEWKIILRRKCEELMSYVKVIEENKE